MSTYDIPWTFAIYSACFALFILYYLTVAKHSRGKFFSILIEKLLKWSYGTNDVKFKMGSISFAILSGQCFISHLEYSDENMHLKILRCQVGYNWWYSSAQEADNDNALSNDQIDDIYTKDNLSTKDAKKRLNLPFRLQIQLTGVQLLSHSATGSWKDIYNIILKQKKKRTTITKRKRRTITTTTTRQTT